MEPGDETVKAIPPSNLSEKPFGAPLGPPAMLRELEDDDDEDVDETLEERLWGLTEMFPESVRKGTGFLTRNGWSLTKWLYSSGRTVLWIVASSASILALPVMFESERAQMEEQQIQQQRQIMLGPNAAMSGIGSMPQISPPGHRQ